MRSLNEIIVHTTATRPEWMASNTAQQKVDEIRRWHVDENGWSDIGYHYVIDRDGTIAEGRPLARIGAHVKGRNTGSVGIAIVGGFGGAETDSFQDHYTASQEASLRALIGQIKSQYGPMSVTGHNQFANKACPCFYVPSWFEGGAVRKVAQVPVEVQRVIDDADKAARDSSTVRSAVEQWGGVAFVGAGTWWANQSDSTQQAALIGGAIVIAGVLLSVRGGARSILERLRKAGLGRSAKAALGGK